MPLSILCSSAVYAADCSPRLTFGADVTVDPRVAQDLRSVGLDRARWFAHLEGPCVLIEDEHHPSEIVHTLYARSPVDHLVYATGVLADIAPGPVHDVVYFYRAGDPYHSELESLIEIYRRKQEEGDADFERIRNMSPEEVKAELAALGISSERIAAEAEHVAALLRKPVREDGLAPANDEDDDLELAAQPKAGAFSGKKILIGFAPEIKASAYGLGDRELANIFLDAPSEGRPFTRLAAYRTGMRWRVGRERRWLGVQAGGKYFAVLVDAPNEHLRVIETLTPLSNEAFRRAIAD